MDHAPSPSAGRSDTAPASGKGRILVVDDDRLVLATVTHGLSQAGYEVIDADNGDDAILLAREHRPELALLDIRMEGKSGFDVAAYLREYLHIPFMFLSAFADDETVQQVRELGAVAYLVKPLDIGQILPTVAAAFANLPQRHAAAAAAAAATAAAALPAVAAAAPAGPVPAAPAVATPERLDLVAVAIGILMHRYSLQRSEAQARLSRLAADEQRPLADQAGRLVEAVELLARGQG
ncbi:MAG: response regulator [Burkholderiaceae bacterium]|nr:response regulator [Burkholderiaceae bacterium]